jgi:hypothetical protein
MAGPQGKGANSQVAEAMHMGHVLTHVAPSLMRLHVSTCQNVMSMHACIRVCVTYCNMAVNGLC